MERHHSSVLTMVAGQGARGVAVAGWKSRLAASGCHLCLSMLVAGIVLACVYIGWYRGPLDSISGVGQVLLLVIAVDVALGPLLTFVVYDRRKSSLPFDLACIGMMQFAALFYGLYTVEAGRPHYLVFVKDRFEVVSTADLRSEDRAAARGNPEADIDWVGPRIVAAAVPSSETERQQILFESISGGRDLQHFPERYRSYESHAELAALRARPLAELRALNPGLDDSLQRAVARTGLAESEVGFLPVKGPADDAAMLIQVSTGAVAGMVHLRPWR